MKRSVTALTVLALALMIARPERSLAQQPTWQVGMRLGLSIFTGYGTGSTTNQVLNQFFQLVNQTTNNSSTSAGLQIGPTGEVIFNHTYAICTAFNINTQGGTPIEWQNTFKYYFNISGSKIRPYADAGFSLVFVTGGPYFGIPFGGGALFPIANHLYIPADLQLGPVFLTGTTAFAIEATTGIRYEI
ncbi:MAG TPA: hypothetical protein VEO56_10035 [Bacteroidota bacterium]|nr:hypothetical protein [Bacteroidota bacterium]